MSTATFLSSIALAQAPPQREFGFGSIGGYDLGAARTEVLDQRVTVAAFAPVYPTFEFQKFGDYGRSFDLRVPITDNIVRSIESGAFEWQTDFLLGLNIGEGAARFALAPGLGFDAVIGRDHGGFAARIPVQTGLEVLTPRRRLGFKFLIIPYFQGGFVRVAGDNAPYVGGGGVFAIGISGYRAR